MIKYFEIKYDVLLLNFRTLSCEMRTNYGCLLLEVENNAKNNEKFKITENLKITGTLK